ncbi:MAG: photosystem reaction center subunit H [Hydrogenophilales bacterium 17-61-76]|nr:MAG: photosystem reaction center subunit H [Hydrogenophilales bacterium 17-61-76]
MTILSSSSISGDKVVNRNGDSLGDISFLGMGSKLFAVPLSAMQVDTPNHQFIFDQSKEKLESAPGFDKDQWPDFADRTWGSEIHAYYGVTPYWN